MAVPNACKPFRAVSVPSKSARRDIQPTLMPRPNPATVLPSLPQGARILIIRLRSLGDTVLLTPAIAALHAFRPDLRISVLLEPPFAQILDGNPAVAETLVLRGSLETIKQMRSRKFAVAYNQHAGPRSALLTAFCGAPIRVCWQNRQYRFAYNLEVPSFDKFFPPGHGHTVENDMIQFYDTGLPQGPIPESHVYPQPDAIAAIAQQLVNCGIARGTPYAVLRPGASAADKRWPVEHFAQLARWLREEKGIAAVWNLGPGDQEVAAATRAAMTPQDVLLDDLDLRQLVALLSGAQLFVGNDSGPTHLAAALQKPVVVIFGNSNSTHWAPWKTRNRLIHHPGAPDGIASVTLEEVRDACSSLLEEARHPPLAIQ
jgi:ADP-heptose:LPS heptosyltransferase